MEPEKPFDAEANRKIIAEFLEMIERLYVENYSLRNILETAKVPRWKEALQETLSNRLLADTIHRTKFASLFEQLRQATRAEVVDEVLRSIRQSSEEE